MKTESRCCNRNQLKAWNKQVRCSTLLILLIGCLDDPLVMLVQITHAKSWIHPCPDDWKLAKVTPIFKQGDRSDMNNYRPISVISAIAKVFERIIYNQLSSYLSENNILSQYQSGFRSFHSTMTALLEATDDWAFNIDRGCVNAVVFLDLKKAFDTVDHPILLSKLYLYGVIGNAYELLSSYLDNRTQRCAVNGVISNTCTLTCGIPQGTIG